MIAVQPRERLAFQLTGDHLDAELTMRALDESRTEVSLVVDGPFLIGLRRGFPRLALERLHSLLRTGEEF